MNISVTTRTNSNKPNLYLIIDSHLVNSAEIPENPGVHQVFYGPKHFNIIQVIYHPFPVLALVMKLLLVPYRRSRRGL